MFNSLQVLEYAEMEADKKGSNPNFDLNKATTRWDKLLDMLEKRHSEGRNAAKQIYRYGRRLLDHLIIFLLSVFKGVWFCAKSNDENLLPPRVVPVSGGYGAYTPLWNPRNGARSDR